MNCGIGIFTKTLEPVALEKKELEYVNVMNQLIFFLLFWVPIAEFIIFRVSAFPVFFTISQKGPPLLINSR